LSRGSEHARARLRGLRVIVDGSVTDEFTDALEQLVPEGDDVGRFVHRALAEPTGVPKLNVVVLRHGEPVLATTLRARQRRWEPATTTVAPTLGMPHRDGLLEPALSALCLPILIQDYFGDAKTDFRRQKLKPFDSYIARLRDFDYEAYWRSTRSWNMIRRAQRQTAELTVVHDDPSTLAWAIDTWEARWTGDPSDEVGAAPDLRIIWPALLRTPALMTTVLVSPEGTPLAGNVNLVDGDTLVGLISARDTDLPTSQGSIGTRAELECWDAARAVGLEKRDLGGYHEYKRRLTPPGRVAYEVEVEPRIIAPDRIARARRLAGKAKRKLQRLAGR